MPGDLRIGRLIVLNGGCNRMGFAEFVHFDDIRYDTALHGLPDEDSEQPRRQKQAAESHEPPVLGLNAGGANTLVP